MRKAKVYTDRNRKGGKTTQPSTGTLEPTPPPPPVNVYILGVEQAFTTERRHG